MLLGQETTKSKEYMDTERECKALQEEFLKKYPNVFNDELLPEDVVNVPHVEIKVNENVHVKPTVARTPAEIPIHLRKATDEEIRSLLKAGVIV